MFSPNPFSHMIIVVCLFTFSTSLASWYSMSYLWYAAIGVSFTFVAGCLFSIFWRGVCFRKSIPYKIIFLQRLCIIKIVIYYSIFRVS